MIPIFYDFEIVLTPGKKIAPQVLIKNIKKLKTIFFLRVQNAKPKTKTIKSRLRSQVPRWNRRPLIGGWHLQIIWCRLLDVWHTSQYRYACASHEQLLCNCCITCCCHICLSIFWAVHIISDVILQALFIGGKSFSAVSDFSYIAYNFVFQFLINSLFYSTVA